MPCCFAIAPAALPVLGLHQDGLYFESTTNTSNLSDLQYTHGKITRGALNWYIHEPSQGSFQWQNVDTYVNNMANAGISVVAVMVDNSQWATGNSDKEWMPWLQGDAAWNTYTNRFADYCSAAATRYGTNLIYEICNEEGFWTPSSTNKRLHIQRYGQMFTAAKNAILAVAPKAIVMIGGLTNIIGGDKTVVGGVEFISALINNGVAFDHLGIHPYGNGHTANPGVHVDGTSNYDDVVLVYNTLKRHQGYQNVKLWCTECGDFDSSALGETTQADYIETILRRADTGFEGQVPQGIIAGVTYFLGRDPDFPADFRHSGVFNVDGTPKQSATRMRNYLAAHPR